MALQSQKHGIPSRYGPEGREFESLLARTRRAADPASAAAGRVGEVELCDLCARRQVAPGDGNVVAA